MTVLLQPHWRLIYIFIAGLAISALHSVNILLILTACVAVLLIGLQLYYRHSLKALFTRWLKFNVFSVLILLTLSWRIGSGGVEWNPKGLELALIISLRMNLIVSVMWLGLFNVTDTVLVQAIGKLPLPSKFIHLFVLTIRYIALLSELNRKMEMAMRARGYQPRCNMRTLMITAQKVSLLLIHAMVKAEKAEIALKARGFKFGKR
ncbi:MULTISPECIES: energy-coupling factor transporter transmembrane protein EcfT [Actinobacillus]|uniref:energy-coupling factor transporter transmembrane component T family protein n=1 Tax=Actinobacillus TaxID=713 RepID=UPI001F31FA35|nr:MULTISPECIES: energy-coupling factor transporter transmembrane component T [Actinobacillus]UKH23297.1 energy-coupling factor transporter transmembrane protein EcfT [Actinobacillus pleuropneumoniae]USQ16257.1 energy-coupling factor transporter transmembrane protein EcfT [Actinobacillus pleuropneumoniae]WGE33576.1 energy-coupling factor transporter transmembrane protein EcfT [Actinobacillus genomosp. 1]WGE35620.1 energy-coupling factor transporter transmembrane protein EcfT [Actinobacillus gen